MEAGEDVKSSWPLCVGLYMCYNEEDSKKQKRKLEQILRNLFKVLISFCNLKL